MYYNSCPLTSLKLKTKAYDFLKRACQFTEPAYVTDLYNIFFRS